ncbi:hypothetical protein [Marinoscillum sp. MHG1-6]|uniref:hypothetical protein n=1 Tax=Marinoscillum sp. MHG1-6 TaxID=2959627 RepID=UPI0021585F77|nr:hypothetical protein [Marinoscillum sp. MHG1-6]
MATYTGILFYWVCPSMFSPIPYDAIPHFIGALFATTFLIPALSVLILKLSKRISSLELSNREERILPFFSIACFYGATAYIFHQKLQISSSIINVMIISTVLIVVLGLVSLKYKISIHAAAIWGLAGIFTSVGQKFLDTSIIPALCGVIIIAGLTSTSRLYLNRHTSIEVWSGSITGFLLCYLCTNFFV